MKYTFQQLKVFQSIVKTLNLRKTASEMYLTPPAITKQLKNLEGNLEFKLFTRQKNRLQLNDKGADFYQTILPVLNELDRIEKIELPIIKKRQSNLNIFEYQMFRKLFQLKSAKNSFKYELTVTTKPEQINKLRTYKIDLSLVVLNEREIIDLSLNGFSAVLYKKIIFNVYISKKLLNKNNLQRVVTDESLILINYTLPDITKANIIRSHSYLSVFEAIKSGIGYGFLPTTLLEDIEKSSLVCIDKYVDQKIISENSYFVFAKNTPKKAMIEILMKTCNC